MYSKGSILVVDDEINLCRILGAKLAKNGYSVVAVHDGVQAVEKIRDGEFDIVLLDLILPKMDGLTALAEIREMKDALPIIIMSACENSDAIEQAMSTGASAYVKKPFDLDNLVSLVQNTSSNGSSHPERRPGDSSALFVKNQRVTLDVPAHNGSRFFHTSIQDKDERTLSVLAPMLDDGLVDIPLNTRVKVGLAAEDAYYSFNSFIIARKNNGHPLLVLDKPGAIYRTQRRSSKRHSVRAQAKYCCITKMGSKTEPLERALALDLSSGGMCLALRESLRPGQLVYVEIDSSEDFSNLSATAQVLHCRKSTEGDIPGFVVGLRFSQIDEGSLRPLAKVN